ncbi:hypothetical protein HanRHA438_Chr05g0237291 [Helianthus annuus]|nr:hypothetical protein HanRHA438_Chr05g0237291 [Helianthus annuus]
MLLVLSGIESPMGNKDGGIGYVQRSEEEEEHKQVDLQVLFVKIVLALFFQLHLVYLVFIFCIECAMVK